MSILNETLSASNVATSWVNTCGNTAFFVVPAKRLLRCCRECLKSWSTHASSRGIGTWATRQPRKSSKWVSFSVVWLISSWREETGIDVLAAADGTSAGGGASAIGISEIKADIASVIQKLIDSGGNPYRKVVFFVDDLDRIPPNDAVEVLEALKNILIYRTVFCARYRL